ncbi:ribonucleotide reductase inhibitor-domain-containing protein [Cercophora newfieldiana]|uniref:Ribonucleotide reductase inhibitor-domain-containing protein n=1 Tax=Cercophora newfieldiana TaxID=92897 RepID=A0AA39YQ59_9PEZI|nr:ribonucleotide reductase inhibitor-domain-containing protein [Cercophora newfieldiana]
MSGPRTKRQFAGASSDPSQRQITAFFSKADPSSTTSPSDTPISTPLNGPVIPPNVQSNLLSVGMRVRKSVVEGYKTDPFSYNAFALWSDSADNTPVASTPAAPFYSPRELAPFCGINKVGGLAVQPLSTIHESTPPHMPMSLTSSQESNSSATSATEAVATTTRKRGYVEEEEGLDVVAAAQHSGPWGEWADGEISPRSFAPAGWGNARVMAMPKTRSRKSGHGAGGTPSSLAELGQENRNADDFDEAPFLSYGEGDMEIE